MVTDRRASNVSSQDSGIIVTTHSPPQIENSTIIPNIPEVEPVNPLNISHTSQTSGMYENRITSLYFDILSEEVSRETSPFLTYCKLKNDRGEICVE